MRELAVDGGLQSVIVGAQIALPEIGLSRAIPELRFVIGLSRRPRAWKGCVDVEVSELVNGLRANVP